MDRRTATGIGLVVVSAAGYATGSVLARPIYDTGIDWLTLVEWRFLIGAILGWIWVAASSERRGSLRRIPRRALLVALALGALFTGNAGTYYAGLETVPAALAGVLVYTYPVIVAVLSLRFATRLPGRRPWIALGLAVVGTVLALGGIFIAYTVWVRRPGTSAQWQERFSGLHKLFVNKWYFDEAIDFLIVRPAAWFGRWGQQTFERVFVNGTLIGGTSGLVRAGSAAVRAAQSGFLRAYAALLLLGVVAVGLYFLIQSA